MPVWSFQQKGNYTNAEEDMFANIQSEGRLAARRTSDSSDQKFRLPRVAERFVKKREKKRDT